VRFENKKTETSINAPPLKIRKLILRSILIISSVRSSLAPTGISVSTSLLTGKMYPTAPKTDLPIWSHRSRIVPLSRPGHNEFAAGAVVPQPELRDQLGCSKLSKLGEIDGVYQLRGAVGGANPPLRLVLGGGGETPPAMWGERL
jgi:hypothetical protein